MKKTLFVVLIVSVMALGGLSTLYAQPTDPEPEWGGDWDYCPYCGNYLGPGYGMGPWMMGRGYGGYGMGPWMMERGYGGYGMGPWMMGRGYGGYGMGPWMMGRGYGGYGMGPWMMGRGYGGYGMGPRMMGRGYGGYGMGPRMMGPGYDYGYGPQSGYGPESQRYSKPLDKDQAKQQVENFLKSEKNPNLKIGKIEEKDKDYEVNIETKDGSLVDKILVSKDTGWMRSAY
jgi:hypothetical protein